jgi:hypothetical protein
MIRLKKLRIDLDTRDGHRHLDVPIDLSALEHIEEMAMDGSLPLAALPPKLKLLRITSSLTRELPPLPDTIQRLELVECSGDSPAATVPLPAIMPRDLCVLVIDDHNQDASHLKLPDGLQEITLNTCYGFPELPDTVHTIRSTVSTKSGLPDVLPRSLVSLHIGECYSDPLPELPSSLRKLYYGYNHPLPRLPEELEMLVLAESFNQELPQWLPTKLKVLALGNYFIQPIPQLPESLIYLELGARYSSMRSKTDLIQLRSGLQVLIIGSVPYDLRVRYVPEDVEKFKDLAFTRINFVGNSINPYAAELGLNDALKYDRKVHVLDIMHRRNLIIFQLHPLAERAVEMFEKGKWQSPFICDNAKDAAEVRL